MSSLSRRQFSVRVSAAVAGGVAGTAARGDDPPAPQTATNDVPDERPEPPAITAEDLQLAVLLDRYPGKHLTPEMIAGIRAGLGHNRREAERIRSAPLPFEIEPAFVFAARRFE